jgi:hypothetical protein
MRNLEYAKDIVGLIGTVLATIPFYKDFSTKGNIQQAEGAMQAADVAPNARPLYEDVSGHFQRRFLTPERSDLYLFTGGLFLLSLSFVLSLIVTYCKE